MLAKATVDRAAILNLILTRSEVRGVMVEWGEGWGDWDCGGASGKSQTTMYGARYLEYTHPSGSQWLYDRTLVYPEYQANEKVCIPLLLPYTGIK